MKQKSSINFKPTLFKAKINQIQPKTMLIKLTVKIAALKVGGVYETSNAIIKFFA